jgi:hypothetical protein
MAHCQKLKCKDKHSVSHTDANLHVVSNSNSRGCHDGACSSAPACCRYLKLFQSLLVPIKMSMRLVQNSLNEISPFMVTSIT